MGQKQRYPVYAVAGVCVVAYILGCITGIEKQISGNNIFTLKDLSIPHEMQRFFEVDPHAFL